MIITDGGAIRKAPAGAIPKDREAQSKAVKSILWSTSLSMTQ
jgi:hypothetical protein